jgi:hypothetical protein
MVREREQSVVFLSVRRLWIRGWVVLQWDPRNGVLPLTSALTSDSG